MTDLAPAGTPPGTPRPDVTHTPPIAGGTDNTVTPPATPTPAAPDAPTPEVAPAAPQIDMSVQEQVTSMVTEAGLDPKEVNRIVREDGMTPAIFQALKEQHGEGIANLLKAQIGTIVAGNKSVAEANDKAVYDLVAESFEGTTEQTGAETWKELSTWAKTNVDTAQRAELNSLLNQGGMAAKLAAQELISVFKKSSDYTQDARLMQADSVAESGTGKPLSKSDYDRDLRVLLNAGHEYGVSQEINNLDRRRMKAIARGM
jgi:hypothetical protein